MQNKAIVTVEMMKVRDRFHPSLSPAYPPRMTLAKPMRELRPKMMLAKLASKPLLSVRNVVKYVEMVLPAALLKIIKSRKDMKVKDSTSFNDVAIPFPLFASSPPGMPSSRSTKRVVMAMTRIGTIHTR